MCNIVSQDHEKHTATIEMSWYDLDLFIKKYDGYAASSLRENDLERAMKWMAKAKEFENLRESLSQAIKD